MPGRGFVRLNPGTLRSLIEQAVDRMASAVR
jgi:bifunctional pyridoxal-dependent enzyme with beta-cystathionase and maltose regulon repressor activities